MFWGMTAGSGGDLQGSVTCQSLADHRSADFLRLSSVLRKLVGFFSGSLWFKCPWDAQLSPNHRLDPPRTILPLPHPLPLQELIDTVSSGTRTVLEYIHNHRNNCCCWGVLFFSLTSLVQLSRAAKSYSSGTDELMALQHTAVQRAPRPGLAGTWHQQSLILPPQIPLPSFCLSTAALTLVCSLENMGIVWALNWKRPEAS